MPPRPPRIPAHRRKRDPLRNARLAPRPHVCDEQCTHPVRGETGGLQPTPTRLAFLRDVDAGHIRRALDGGTWRCRHPEHTIGHEVGSVVDDMVRVTLAAGWITDQDPTTSTYVTASLTARGRQILAEHGEDR